MREVLCDGLNNLQFPCSSLTMNEHPQWWQFASRKGLIQVPRYNVISMMLVCFKHRGIDGRKQCLCCGIGFRVVVGHSTKASAVTISPHHCYFIDFLLLRVMLTDTMHSMDVPRDSGSLTRTFSFMSHVPGSCTCMSPIPFHMYFHFTVLGCRLVYAYHSVLCLLLLSR